MAEPIPTADCRETLTGLGDAEFAEIEGIYPKIYDELRQLAERRMRQERRNHTMQPTALVNEVYLKLSEQSRARIKSKTHVIALASVAMQRILCDSGRARKSDKRGGGWNRVEFEGVEGNDSDDRMNEAMADAIAFFAKDRKALVAAGQAAHKRMASAFSMSALADRLDLLITTTSQLPAAGRS